jgi:hypothetical protein
MTFQHKTFTAELVSKSDAGARHYPVAVAVTARRRYDDAPARVPLLLDFCRESLVLNSHVPPLGNRKTRYD